MSPWVYLRGGRPDDVLPDDETDVLIYCPGEANGDYQVGCVTTDVDGLTWLGAGSERVNGVEAWMPFPLAVTR